MVHFCGVIEVAACCDHSMFLGCLLSDRSGQAGSEGGSSTPWESLLHACSPFCRLAADAHGCPFPMHIGKAPPAWSRAARLELRPSWLAQSEECLNKAVQTMRCLGRSGSHGQADFFLLTGSSMRQHAFHLLRLRCCKLLFSCLPLACWLVIMHSMPYDQAQVY